MNTTWPYHVKVSRHDGSTWENDYADHDLAEFTAASRSKNPEVESAVVSIAFRDGAIIDPATLVPVA